MYPFERYMKVFKGMVHNRTFPEGCIAECYIVEEAVEFLEERILPENATAVGISKSSRPGLLNGCKCLSAPKIVTANGNQLDITHLFFGRIVHEDLDPNKQTIHDIPLGAENVRVSIVVPIIGHHLLSCPIKDEILTMKDVLGSIVAWQRNLIIEAAIDVEAIIFRKDIHAMTHMTELTSSCIIFYISYLNEVLKKSQMTDMVGFVDPNHTGALECGTPTERSKNRFKNRTNDQIYLVPHNSGYVLDVGIKFYYAQKTKKSSRVSVEWIPLLGILEQKDGKTCAYLVMRYIKDIIVDKDLEFATTWKTKQGLRYTPEQIVEVRAEWAKQVLMFKV
ncbi:hypothetical protein ACLB2K_050995 [Fragaria x ananassa]